MARVVGWLLREDNTCEQCKVNTASVIVTFDGYTGVKVCRNCLPQEYTDSIAEVLRRIAPE